MSLTLSATLALPRCPHCRVAIPHLSLQMETDTNNSVGNNSRRWGVYLCSTCGGLVAAWGQSGTPIICAAQDGHDLSAIKDTHGNPGHPSFALRGTAMIWAGANRPVATNCCFQPKTAIRDPHHPRALMRSGTATTQVRSAPGRSPGGRLVAVLECSRPTQRDT